MNKCYKNVGGGYINDRTNSATDHILLLAASLVFFFRRDRRLLPAETGHKFLTPFWREYAAQRPEARRTRAFLTRFA